MQKRKPRSAFRRKWKGGRQLSLSRILCLFFPFRRKNNQELRHFPMVFLCEGLGGGKRGRRTIFHFRICQSVKSDNSQFPSTLRAKTIFFAQKMSDDIPISPEFLRFSCAELLLVLSVCQSRLSRKTTVDVNRRFPEFFDICLKFYSTILFCIFLMWQIALPPILQNY